MWGKSPLGTASRTTVKLILLDKSLSSMCLKPSLFGTLPLDIARGWELLAALS